MNTQPAPDFLAPFRAREHAFRANAITLLRDPTHAYSAPLRVALAWRVLPVAWTLPQSPCPMTEAEIWLWLWEGVEADETALAEACGIPPEDVRHWLKQLIANRLIYPDSTVANVVDEIGNRALADVSLPKGLG